MARMRTRGLLAALVVFAACAEDDPGAACSGDRPVQLFEAPPEWTWIHATAEPAADRTYITVDSATDGSSTRVGPDCGVTPTLELAGIALKPARIHLDPRDDDPELACDEFFGELYRVDVAGAGPPRLLLPHLRCDPVPTRHGPIFGLRGSNAAWLVPDFPDDSTAVQIADRVWGLAAVDDFVYFGDFEGDLRRTSLVTGETRLLADGVAEFRVTATHALLRSSADPDTAPIDVLDLATGTRTHVGLFHRDEDFTSLQRASTERAWDFDPTGQYIVHFPKFPTPMAAYDLAGRPVAFPALGEAVFVAPGGTFVIQDGAGMIAARPGDPDVIPLDAGDNDPYGYPRFVDDRLEIVIGGDLYEIPLDGSPRRLLAREIGAMRQWLDDDSILTITGAGTLTVVLAAANVRRALASLVVDFKVVPGRGAHFTIFRAPGAPDNGLWFAPEAALFPAVPPCETSFYCR
jgi:hypothetical protein